MFWRADAFARLVRLVPCADGDCLVHYEPERWGGRQHGRLTPDGYHLIVSPVPGVAQHLLLPGPDPPPVGTPLAPEPAFDPWFPERAAAAEAFWRFAQMPRVSRAPSVPVAKRSGRTLEFAFMIWALDLKQAGAADRDVARALWSDAPANWSDSPLRAQVRRLLLTAKLSSASKYRILLKLRRPALAPI